MSIRVQPTRRRSTSQTVPGRNEQVFQMIPAHTSGVAQHTVHPATHREPRPIHRHPPPNSTARAETKPCQQCLSQTLTRVASANAQRGSHNIKVCAMLCVRASWRHLNFQADASRTHPENLGVPAGRNPFKTGSAARQSDLESKYCNEPSVVPGYVSTTPECAAEPILCVLS